MFCALDVDEDGFLRKDEYRAFLVCIGMWDSQSMYTDARWDAQWLKELADLGCDPAGRGVNRAGLTLLYTKCRGVAKLDVESAVVVSQFVMLRRAERDQPSCFRNLGGLCFLCVLVLCVGFLIAGLVSMANGDTASRCTSCQWQVG